MKYAPIVAAFAVLVIPVLAEDTPEKAVVAFTKCMADTNFEAAVKLVHPSELAKVRDAVIPSIEKAAGTNALPPMLRAFTRDENTEALAKLTPEQVCERLLTWGVGVQPGWVADMKRTTVAPLGHVKEGDLAHVVCRETTAMTDTNVSRLTVYSAMKDKDAWKTIPPYLQGMAQRLTKMVSYRPPARIPTRTPGTTTPPSTFGPIGPVAPGPQQPRSRLPGGTPPLILPAAPGTQTPAPAQPAAPTLQPAAPTATAPKTPAAPESPAK